MAEIKQAVNKRALSSFIKKMNEQKKGYIFNLMDANADLEIPRWSTGIIQLDNILGGGMPYGSVIEVYGGTSSGKTSFGHHLCSLHEYALNIPIEGTFAKERALTFDNSDNLFIVRAMYGEEAFKLMYKFSQFGFPCIVLDSVNSMRSLEERKRLTGNMEKKKDAKLDVQRPGGGVAKVMSEYTPELVNIIEQTNTTIIMINQTRKKIGSFGFGDNEITTGGDTLDFYARARIKTGRIQNGWLKIKSRDPMTTNEDTYVGLIQKFRTMKSKISNPYQECVAPIIFDRGYVDQGDVEEIIKELQEKENEKHGYGKRKNAKAEVMESPIENVTDPWEAVEKPMVEDDPWSQLDTKGEKEDE